MTVQLTEVQTDTATEVLTRAFLEDPVYSVLFSDPEVRKRCLRGMWKALIRYTLKYGEIETTEGIKGVALWLTPGNTQPTFYRMLRTGFAIPRAVMAFPRLSRRRFFRVLSHLDEIHKQLIHKPHFYLWVLGVDPRFQGRGIGGQLIEPVLAKSDRENIPCYLEAMTEANARFYEKRGFVTARVEEVPNQGKAIKVWLMLKDRPR